MPVCLLLVLVLVVVLAVEAGGDGRAHAGPPPEPKVFTTAKQATGGGSMTVGHLRARDLPEDPEIAGGSDDVRLLDPVDDLARALKNHSRFQNPSRDADDAEGSQALLPPLTNRAANHDRLAVGMFPANDGVVAVWDGFPYTGWLPASPQVAAGPEQVVTTVNSRVRVMDKHGQVLASSSLRQWMETAVRPLGVQGVFVTSPWVVFDAREQRFVLSALATRLTDGETAFLVAISETSQADGHWCVFGMGARYNGLQTTDTMATDLRIGLNRDSVILAANMATITDGRFAYAKVRLLPKSRFYKSCAAGADWSDAWDFRDAKDRPVSDMRPVQGEGDDPLAYLVSSRFDAGDALALWRVPTESGTAPLGDPPRPIERLDIPVPAFSIAPDALQPGTDIRVSTGSASLQGAQQRGRSLWTAQTVACSWPGEAEQGACVRWYELDLDKPGLVQSGTFGDPGGFTFDPSVMPDTEGNAAIVFNRASPHTSIEGDLVCRSTDAPIGRVQTESSPLVQGEGCYVRLGGTDYNRWGRHSGIAMDPSSGRTWAHLAYASGSSSDCSANAWRTALADVNCAAIAAPARSPTPDGTLQAIRPRGGAPTPRPSLAPPCMAQVDVMLVLDSSGSIGSIDYETVRSFARALVASLRVAPDGARVGIAQFSSPSQNRLETELSADPAALNRVIESMKFLAGSTDMVGGLQIGLDEMRRHGRTGIPGVVIMMSDGQPNQGDPGPVAAEIKQAGFRLITIGVGSGIDATLMKNLASAPADDNFIFAEDFDALLELIDRLVLNLCPRPQSPTPPPTATNDARLTRRLFLPLLLKEPACPPEDRFIDVALVLDASTSMLAPGPDGRAKYLTALDAARNFAAQLRLRPGGDQLALVSFNSKARLLLSLTDDAASTDAALRNFTRLQQGSRLELGIQAATAELGSRRARRSARAMVVLSDGQTNPSHGDASVLAAAVAKGLGVVIYVVGMGPDMNVATLEPIASGGSRFFPAPTDDLLTPAFAELIQSLVCARELFWPWVDH